MAIVGNSGKVYLNAAPKGTELRVAEENTNDEHHIVNVDNADALQVNDQA